MRRPARARDNDLDPALSGCFCVLGHPFWGAMGGGDFGFISNAKRIQHISGVFHGWPIGLTAHANANSNIAAVIGVISSLIDG